MLMIYVGVGGGDIINIFPDVNCSWEVSNKKIKICSF